MHELKTLLEYNRTSIKSSVSLRESFLLQSFFMLISNLVFFSFWWIYFQKFSAIKGWTLSDMACLYGIVNGAYGFFCVFFGGSRYIARMIFEGDLDALIVKPKNLLLQVLGTKSISSGWGDLLSSATFLIASDDMTLLNIPLILLFILTACAIITSFSIILGSLAFWMVNSHSLSKQIFEFLLTFSNYPKSIYVGTIKFFLLMIIPSGFIGFIPMDTIKNFSVYGLIYVVVFSIFYSYLATKVFYWGLHNYSSGSKPGFRV